MNQLCLKVEPLTVPLEEACRVLVLRSLEDQDPLHNVFENALKQWGLRDRVEFGLQILNSKIHDRVKIGSDVVTCSNVDPGPA